MGKPKRNKKAEIKARRKTRKVNEHIRDLKTREKRAKAFLQHIMGEHAETFEKLAGSEIEESISSVVSPSSSSEDPQSNQ